MNQYHATVAAQIQTLRETAFRLAQQGKEMLEMAEEISLQADQLRPDKEIANLVAACIRNAGYPKDAPPVMELIQWMNPTLAAIYNKELLAETYSQLDHHVTYLERLHAIDHLMEEAMSGGGTLSIFQRRANSINPRLYANHSATITKLIELAIEERR